MAFGFAGAAGGASDALQQILARAFAEKQAQEEMELRRRAAERQDSAQQLQERQFTADEDYRGTQLARQTKLDDAAASDRNNQRGMQLMLGDYLTQKGQPLEGLAAQAGIDLRRIMPDQPSPPSDFTLAPGSKRFSPEGREIASVAPTPAAPPKPERVEQEWVIRDGVITPIPKGTARPGDQPATRASSARSVTSGDAGRISEFDTSLDDVDVLERDLGRTGVGSKVGAMLPNVVTEVTGLGSDSKSRQAVIDRVKQVIGKALEGGVLRKEDEYKYEKILPTIGDPPEVAKTKIAGLRSALIQRRQRFIESLEDAGFDVSKYGERTKPTTPTQTPAGGGRRVYYDMNGNPVSR